MAAWGKKLINDPNDVVTQFIEGLVETYPGLQYLDGFPEVKVVLRSDVEVGTYDKVAVICGGGSGHEPAHGGFVGQGMLTAAVSGDVFTSPPVNSILAAIRAVTGPKGCLLVVTNYTGDRLNFGLAAEEAKSEGYKVEMVIVGDDCALSPTQGIAGRRGLAGTILVNKVAGAAADAGLPLEEVAEQARHASKLVGTMGVALSVCTLPGQGTSDRLGPHQMELGLGIHGEPGAAVIELEPVDAVVTRVLKQILSPETQYVPITRGDRVILLTNGLGATPIMELMIATRKTVHELQLEYDIATDRVYTGSFMTSLDMQGFSISLMKSDTAILKCLDASTKAPCWPAGTDGDWQKPAKIAVPAPPSCAMKSDKNGSGMRYIETATQICKNKSEFVESSQHRQASGDSDRGGTGSGHSIRPRQATKSGDFTRGGAGSGGGAWSGGSPRPRRAETATPSGVGAAKTPPRGRAGRQEAGGSGPPLDKAQPSSASLEQGSSSVAAEEPAIFVVAERDAEWRKAMLEEMGTVFPKDGGLQLTVFRETPRKDKASSSSSRPGGNSLISSPSRSDVSGSWSLGT